MTKLWRNPTTKQILGQPTQINNWEEVPIIAQSTFEVKTSITDAVTLTATDASCYIRCNNANSITVTIPAQSSVAWEEGAEIILEQTGVGTVTIAGDAGVSLLIENSASTANQYSRIAIKRVAENVWAIAGSELSTSVLNSLALADSAVQPAELDAYLAIANNLDDVADLPTVLVNLGLENVDNTADLDKPVSTATTTAISTAISTVDLSTCLRVSNNLDDLNDVATALVNLGLNNVDNTSDADKPVSSATATAISNAIAAIVPAPFEVKISTGTSKTLDLTDVRKYVRCANVADITVTVPPQSSVSWPSSAEIIIEQASTGKVTIAAGVGVTLRGGTAFTTANPNATLSLKRVSEDEWILNNGALSPSILASLALADTSVQPADITNFLVAADVADFLVAADVADFLTATNNLSDLDDASTARTNLGLGNINNTADLSKPISTATQSALDSIVSDVTDNTNAIEALPSISFPITTYPGTSITLALVDSRRYIRCASDSPVTVTVPTQSAVAWPADTEIVFEQSGNGQITIAPAAGVTIRTSETLKSRAKYATIGLKRTAENVWTLTGEREFI